MGSHRNTFRTIAAVFSVLSCFTILSNAQVQVINGIDYKQITSFETDYSIIAMKISGDGTKIVFATGGPQVKVFTIDSDGSGLTQIYDFQRTGSGPMVDIDAAGDKVIWCDGEGEIFIANSDGSNVVELATLLPNPDPNFGDMEPVIPLPPRITADGSQVLFIHTGRDPRGAGVWRVGSDDTNLTQVFNYNDMASDLFGDSAAYNFNTAFSDGFDISADGTRMIFGTKIFKLAAGDLNRGDAIAVDGTDFYNVGHYAPGNQPFATYVDGDFFTMFRREFNAELGYDEINIYSVPLGTGSDIKLIGGLDIFGTSSMTQMASDGFHAIVHGANGRLPITRLDGTPQGRLDLVSIDVLSMAIGSNRFSESRLPSITWDAQKFCFLSTGIPPQIWVATINSDAINSSPSITEIRFEPDEVAIDGSTTATISAHVNLPGHDIHTVTFDVFREGAYIFRALSADWPYSGMLRDDGTFGDEFADDWHYTNNTVRADLPQTPLGTYTIRIAAADHTLREVSSADATPFFLVEPSASAIEKQGNPGYYLDQNFPNPFKEVSSIGYGIPVEGHVALKILDVLGKEVKVLVDSRQVPGRYTVQFDANELPGGFYFCTMKSGDFYQVRKIQLVH